MACKICQEKPVWKFTNQTQLCEKCFTDYFEKKVKRTIGRYHLPIGKISSSGLKARVVNRIIQDLPERKGKIGLESLNDISDAILYEMMYGKKDKLKTLLPNNKPLYFLSDREIEIYAKIKGIKGKLESRESKNKKLKQIDDFLKIIERKNPDIRHNVVKALLNYHL